MLVNAVRASIRPAVLKASRPAALAGEYGMLVNADFVPPPSTFSLGNLTPCRSDQRPIISL